MFLLLLLYLLCAHVSLHSFPTRRSSDLSGFGGAGDTDLAVLVNRFLAARGAQEDRAVEDRAEQVGPHIDLRCVPQPRSEDHTSELQSLRHLVCRLLLEKTKTQSRFRPVR